MSGYEEQELTDIDAVLDGNPDASSSEVFQATRPYDERAIASVAASRALAGGGGSQTYSDGTTSVVATELRFPPLSISDLGGGVAGVNLLTQLIGPFNVTYQTPGIAPVEDGALVTSLPAGAVVLQLAVFILNAGGFDGASQRLVLNLGGPNYGAPNDDYQQLGYVGGGQGPVQGTGYKLSAPIVDPVVGLLSGEGAIVVGLAAEATQGEADIYAVIATPAT